MPCSRTPPELRNQPALGFPVMRGGSSPATAPCHQAVRLRCVPPGARLRLRDIPEHLQRVLRVEGVEEVTFVQQSLEAFRHRDAVRFSNGKEILLQRLQCGQRVEVVNLGGADEKVKPQRTARMNSRLLVG